MLRVFCDKKLVGWFVSRSRGRSRKRRESLMSPCPRSPQVPTQARAALWIFWHSRMCCAGLETRVRRMKVLNEQAYVCFGVQTLHQEMVRTLPCNVVEVQPYLHTLHMMRAIPS